MERAAEVASRFGLGALGALSQFESFGNENWLYEDTGGRRSVLRRYEHAAFPRVQFQVELQVHLQHNGFPASEVLYAPGQERIYLDGHGCPWVAFQYVDGREYNFSREDAVQAAEALARFHLLGARAYVEAPPLAHRPSLRECWQRAEQDVAELRGLFAGIDVEAELDYLSQWWRAVRSDWPLDRLDALPTGLVHGDFHGRNLAFAGGRLAAVFDFDDVELAPLLQDVAMGLYKFGRESRFSLRLRPDVVNGFLAAYGAVRPLTAEEMAALPVLLAMQYPPNAAYYRYYREHHGSDLVRRLRREVATMQALRRQVNLLPL